jgi:hypothetical protein
MKETVTLDDLTGAEADDAAEIDVMFGNDTYTLDLAAESREALLILFRDHDSEPLRNLLSPIVQAVEVKAAAKAPSGPAASEIRAYAKAKGWDVPDKGKLPGPIKERYRAEHQR